MLSLAGSIFLVRLLSGGKGGWVEGKKSDKVGQSCLKGGDSEYYFVKT